MTIHVPQDLPILIAGGGPSGLALAQGLRKRGIPFRVFERDVETGTRQQGWAVALQWITPRLEKFVPDDLPPLRTVSHLYELGLQSQVAAFDAKGNVQHKADEGDGFLRADRSKLRDWLGTNIKIEWDHRVVRYEEKPDRVTVYFEDGSSIDGSALVGADGGRSQVRKQLLPEVHELQVPDLDSIGATLELPKKEYLELCETMGRSVNVIQCEKTFMFLGLHKIDEDGETAHMYWMLTRPTGLQDSSIPLGERTKELLYKQANEWSQDIPESFRRLVEQAKVADYSPWDNFTRVWDPLEHEIASKRVTVMGDAAHKVTPLGGGGVNHAIEDALDMCEKFDEAKDITAALQAYSKIVRQRGHEAVARSTRWPVLP